jgi:hypothetical protein
MTMSRRNLLATFSGLFGAKLARPGSATAEDLVFPADFVWGASTSSYQIEGGRCRRRGKSIWDVFPHAGPDKGDDTGDVACDHYHRWAEDIEWLARGGFKLPLLDCVAAHPAVGAGVVRHAASTMIASSTG